MNDPAKIGITASEFRGKVCVVTGAGSGIGRALAVALAGHGAELALSDRDETGLAATVARVRALGARVGSEQLDVSDRKAVFAYADRVAQEFGRVDVVINNAGISFTGDVLEMTIEQIERVMDVDFWGVVYGSKAFLPYLIASGDGRLVNVSSLFGIFAVPGQSAYNAAKFAVRGFSEALRQEMRVSRTPVAVTCVHPGGIKTGIIRNSGHVEGLDKEAMAKYFDKRLAPTTAEKAAQTILKAAGSRKARVLVGPDAVALDAVVRVIGSKYQDVFSRVAHRSPFARR